MARGEDSEGSSLDRYKAKRNFAITPEPVDGGAPGADLPQFVIHKHWATRLHYDLRLEIGGTMKSWAVPKGPSLDPADKRMAIEVEDHPISYNAFEGQIPARQYGAGRVIIWDKGFWEPLGNPAQDWRDGHLKFLLHGHKLQGRWALVRMAHSRDSKKPAWLLIKERDAWQRPSTEFDVVQALPDSVGATPLRELPTAPLKAAGKTAAARTRAAPSVAPSAALPKALAPALAQLLTQPPQDIAQWLFELKFDGYRLLARVERGKARLLTRNGHDWTERMPRLAQAVQALPLRSGWLDGEIAVLDESGAPDFQRLQNAFDAASTDALVYYLFDLPFCNGKDLRALPVVERRARLAQLLQPPTSPQLRLSEAFEARPEDLVAAACQIGFEGVIGKRKASPYASGRHGDWIKLKCGHRQEFVVLGYTPPKGSRLGIGALLLGVHGDDGKLVYAGSVGSGFTDRSLQELHAQLSKLETRTALIARTAELPARVHWVQPQLVAEVAFAQWTEGHRIRHSVFKGLRQDKPAKAITREEPVPPASNRKAMPAPPPPRLSGARSNGTSEPRVSHPDRVIDASTGLRKIDLVRYYATVGPLMLEHLHHRPVALVRAPEGVAGPQFFQKHQETAGIKGVAALDPGLDPGHAPLLAVTSVDGLLSTAQLNVVEYHTWNARQDRIERPDRMTFDLDPGEGVAWELVQEGANLVHTLLTELGLPAFLKTSGGKGLHIVVPLKRLRDWDTVKAFSARIVQHLARVIPERFVAKSGPRNRVGKIFVDYLRNGRGATTVSAWSARARPGMGVSVPVAWDELARLESAAHWTVENIEARLRTGNGPWQGYAQAAVSLSAAMKLLDGIDS